MQVTPFLLPLVGQLSVPLALQSDSAFGCNEPDARLRTLTLDTYFMCL